jgi:hypothetical protein
MGKHRKGKKGFKKGGKDKGGKERDNNKEGGGNVWKHDPWLPLVPHNDLFEAYYKVSYRSNSSQQHILSILFLS